MKFFKNFTFIIFLFFCSSNTIAQGVAIGEWRTHLPYQKVIDVDFMGSNVYAATPYDLFYYNKDDNSINILNKVNGLNDIGISALRYNNNQKLLMVAYTNTNVDLIYENGDIVNISDIKDKELLGNKTINDIFFFENNAYLSCGFGIVVIDLERIEVKDTYIIGPEGTYININDITIFNNKIYAATESGIFYAPFDSPNLADYNQWTQDTEMIHPNLNYNLLELFDNKIFANYTQNEYNKDTMFVFDGNSWDYFEKANNSLRKEIRAVDDKLLVCNNYGINIYDEQLLLLQNIYAPGEHSIEPQTVNIDSQGHFWIGDKNLGMIYSTNGFNGEIISPNGPYTTSVYELKSGGKNIWVASGGRASNWSKLWMREGVFHFDGSWWKTHNQSNTDAFDSISDFVSVSVDPSNSSKAYIGTWMDGVLEFTDGELTNVYSVNNSSLGPWLASPTLVNISGLDFDSYNNLWVANTGATNLLSMRNTSGEWTSFNLGASNSGIDIANMIVDRNNYKWIIKRSEGKIIVFNDNNTFNNSTDDQVKTLTSNVGSGNIHGNSVYCMAVDDNGTVWVGTDDGPATIYNPDNIFESGYSYDATRILVPRDDGSGQADPLLEGQKILSMAVDGANNIWFGTENGVFQLSNDGLAELNYFNTENSPLLSNTVSSIAITDNGEVFFGTNSGIISYRSSAAEGGETNSNVYAYPNPVRPDYQGVIAITGVVSNALIKITTVNGALITQIRAEGGQAIWDGKTLNGKDVNPGVYLVFVSTDAGEQKLVTKILMMR